MKSHTPACDHSTPAPRPTADPRAVDRAACLFRAMGDPQRLRLLYYLSHGECCVSEVVAATGEKFSTISQRLKVLRAEGLIARRRDKSHIFYKLADKHVARLVADVLAHAGELERIEPHSHEVFPMSNHANHTHAHGPDCGHKGVQHGDHVDYLHDGHLHHPTAGGQVEEHKLDVTGSNPAGCVPHDCGSHDAAHVHGPDCGHEAVPHGDHVDYIVDGHLHHPHGDHCDDHGPVTVV